MYKIDLAIVKDSYYDMILDGEEFTLAISVDNDTGAVTGSAIVFSRDEFRKFIGEKSLTELLKSLIIDLKIHKDDLTGVTFFTGYIIDGDPETILFELKEFLVNLKKRHFLN